MSRGHSSGFSNFANLVFFRILSEFREYLNRIDFCLEPMNWAKIDEHINKV